MVEQETQGGDDALPDLMSREIAALVSDAEGCQAEPGGGDAGDTSRIGATIGQGPVAHQAGVLAGFLPEKQETAADDFFQQFVIG